MQDINILVDNIRLNCRAVAVISDGERILLQKRKNDKFWALPGGKIAILEKSEETIKREIQEELDLKKFKVNNLVGVSEHFFEFGGEKCHQYIFMYKVDVERSEWIYEKNEFDGAEKEKDLVYKWLNINELKTTPIKPDFIASQILNMDKEGIQFISYTEN